MPRVFIAAGSNISPRTNLALAIREMRLAFPTTRVSQAYQNSAVGFDGPDFINLVAGFQTELSLHEVLTELHRIEALCGRSRDAPKWQPRSMDLDMLLYGDLVCNEPALTLPRPDLIKRAYMLGPMAEIAGEIVHPTLHLTMRELWMHFDRDAHPMRAVSIAENV